MKNIDYKDTVSIGDKDNAKYIIIWFHGYGANNWDMEPVMKTLNMVCNNSLYIFLPNAPITEGRRSWYPLPKIDSNNEIVEDYDGLMRTHKMIHEAIDYYQNKNPQLFKEKKIIFGGFSQGGALALSMHLAEDKLSSGAISIAGYMPCATSFENINYSIKNVFLAHGTKDLTITIETHKKTLEFLNRKKINVNDFSSTFGHTITKEVISETSYWLKDYFGSL
ncbi:MAG: hypothetical protein CMD88_00260 [Gammaproteobacteria bacterium]|nr:hypothetical protein [Gammaproteobacteria bacterium]|tara:strand:- start:440 stop:1105 length:666 start_codon:yes stop_codon:yes gene_type:complete